MATKQKQQGTWRITLTVLLGMAMFVACPGNGNARGSQEEMRVTEACGRFGRFESEGLSAEMERRILTDFGRHRHSDPNRYMIYGFYGTHNGFIVVDIIRVFAPDEIPSITGVHRPPFRFLDWYIQETSHFHYHQVAWRNGRFYRIPDLYRDGKLTINDLRNIADTHPLWEPAN